MTPLAAEVFGGNEMGDARRWRRKCLHGYRRLCKIVALNGWLLRLQEVLLLSNPTYFVQGCPTCGRRLQVRVEHLGRSVVCQHCRGRFVARDPSLEDAHSQHAANDLLRRADELLQFATRQAEQSRSELT